MIKRISHLGLAVDRLEAAVEIFSRLLDRPPQAIEEVVDQKVRLAIFETAGSRIELLEGTSSDSAIARFIEKRGPGIHHFCLEVDDLAAEIGRLEAAGFEMIDKVPRPGAEGKLVAFIHPRSTAGILIELSQS